MDINNPQIFDHIIDDTGDELRPDELSNTEIAAETFEAKGIFWENQTSGNYHVNRCIVDENDNVLQCKILEIGDWDMDTTSNKSVAHGLSTTYQNIRRVDVIIRNDLDNEYHVLNRMDNGADPTLLAGGVNQLNITYIKLYRRDGSYFDDNDYDSTSYNRGWVTVWWQE